MSGTDEEHPPLSEDTGEGIQHGDVSANELQRRQREGEQGEGQQTEEMPGGRRVGAQNVGQIGPGDPLLDEHVYVTDPTRDPKVTHAVVPPTEEELPQEPEQPPEEPPPEEPPPETEQEDRPGHDASESNI